MTPIESLRSSLTALEDLARNLGMNPEELYQQRSESQNTNNIQGSSPDTDSVDITPITLRRLQSTLSNEQPLEYEDALNTLGTIQNAMPDDLAEVHGHLDPQRVYSLLGLKD